MQNKSNVETIATLKQQVLHLDTEAKKAKTTDSATRTSLECEFCRYPAKDLLDLGEHVYQCHGPEEESEENSIICYICGWKLDSKEDLMKHRKEKHERSVRICQYFIKGCCERSASECWYKHDSANHNIKEFKCSECDIVFDLKFDLMRHRKHEHPKHVSVCTKNRNVTSFWQRKVLVQT